MLRGLPASIALHVAVIGLGYLAWPSAEDIEQRVVAVVPIELVTISEVTNVRPVAPRVVEEEPEEEVPEAAEEPEDLQDILPPDEEGFEEEDPEPPPPPKPEVAEEEPDVLPTEEPEPETKPEEKPPEKKPEPKPKPKPPEPEEDPLAGLLDDSSNLFSKEKTKAPEPKPVATEKKPEEKPKPTSTQGTRGAGEKTRNEATVEAMLVSLMKVCWDDVQDQPDPGRLLVTVQVELDKDGRLTEQPKLVKPARAPIGDRPMQVAIERALLATQRCAPYRLPAEDYEIWKEITFTIGPEQD